MAHVSLTCKNHPNLRWNCKEEAVNPTGNNGQGCYTGARRLFFSGDVVLDDPHADECACPASDLILAPQSLEDAINSAPVYLVDFDSEE
jgi:hypothetical protein